LPHAGLVRIRATSQKLAASWISIAQPRLLPTARIVALALCVGILALAAFRELLPFSWGSAPDVWPSVKGAERAFFLPSETSPGIVLIVFVFLVARWGRDLLAHLDAPVHPVAAAALFAPALALVLWSHYTQAPALLLPSLGLMLLGIGYSLAGRVGVTLLLLPAAFLYFAWPAPRVLTNEVVLPLQLFIAKATSWLIGAVGIPVRSVGDQVYTQRAVFEVIETCSGMRALDTLPMAAVVYTQLFLTPWRRGLLLVLAAFPLAVFLNLVRVLTIILNPYSAVIGVHTFQGIAVIVLGVLLIAALDRLLTRFLPGTSTPGPRLADTCTLRPGRWAAVVAILVGIAAGVTLIPRWQPQPRPPHPLFIRLPNQFGGWSAQILKHDARFEGALYSSESTYRRYRRGNSEVVVFAAEDERLHPFLTLISPKTAYPGAGWEIESSEDRHIDALGVDVTVLVMRSMSGRRLVYHWYQGRGPLWLETLRQALTLDRGPFRRSDSLLALRIETPMESGRQAAETVLARFIQAMAQTPLYAGSTSSTLRQGPVGWITSAL